MSGELSLIKEGKVQEDKVRENIRNYWEARAIENANSRQATTNDVYLRKLEISSIVETLKDITRRERNLTLPRVSGSRFVSSVEVFVQFTWLGAYSGGR
jgi:hypothetical protein